MRSFGQVRRSYDRRTVQCHPKLCARNRLGFSLFFPQFWVLIIVSPTLTLDRIINRTLSSGVCRGFSFVPRLNVSCPQVSFQTNPRKDVRIKVLLKTTGGRFVHKGDRGQSLREGVRTFSQSFVRFVRFKENGSKRKRTGTVGLTLPQRFERIQGLCRHPILSSGKGLASRDVR